jgi:8-oxo-dGTP pyrophosphatase MutT (NUDIX family)
LLTHSFFFLFRRYPGEYKFAGGNVEENETTLAAAKRELDEELLKPCGISLPDSAVFRPFAVKQTRPIRGRSNLMFNYVLFAAENPWLEEIPVSRINTALEKRRDNFAKLLRDSSFWKMPKEEKEKISPEVRSVEWVNLRDACKFMLSSMNPKVIHVNEFQKKAFAKYGVKRRDPMYITGATLFELEGFPTKESLIKYSKTADMNKLAKDEQWCFSGWTQGDLDEAFESRMNNEFKVNPSFKTLAQIKELKMQRQNNRSKL